MADAIDDPKILAQEGLRRVQSGDWDRGLPLLGRAAESKNPGLELPGLVYSYLGFGIAHREKRIRDGIQLCEHAIKLQFYEPQNHLNLAKVRLLANDRKKAVQSIAAGLKLDPRHAGLRALREEIGVRRAPVLRFLARDNPLNVLLGRLRHGIRGE
ncbi:MAG: hypothetical protein U0X73_16350 [Thermoanaerobaculia bacterium]